MAFLPSGHSRYNRRRRSNVELSAGKKRFYELGLGKNKPLGPQEDNDDSCGLDAAGKAPLVNGTVVINSTTSSSATAKTVAAAAAAAASIIKDEKVEEAAKNWNFEFSLAEDVVRKPPTSSPSEGKYQNVKDEDRFTIKSYDVGLGKNRPLGEDTANVTASANIAAGPGKKKLVANDKASEFLSRAVWDKEHYDKEGESTASTESLSFPSAAASEEELPTPIIPEATIQDIPSTTIPPPTPTSTPLLPSTTTDQTTLNDPIWTTMRQEALLEAQREPLLVSFLFASILNHPTLESALAFHLANRLSSPAMISTQVQSLVLEALENSKDFRESVRRDMVAVRERDPACTALPDVFLYFKGFHALQTYRVAHYLWKSGRRVLAHYLQSQMSQVFQIDIHPNATLGSGIMLDHGTGIVIGETAIVGHNCSILHHVTLGGSGRKGVDRHPKIGDGVLLGAGASILGNVRVGNGCQVGAGTLVIDDLEDRSVAVGVPAKVIGSFVDEGSVPSENMNQVGTKECEGSIRHFATDGI